MREQILVVTLALTRQIRVQWQVNLHHPRLFLAFICFGAKLHSLDSLEANTHVHILALALL